MAVVQRKRADIKRELWAIRLSADEKKQIRQRADAKGMTMTDFVVQCALGTLDRTPGRMDQRMRDLEERMEALERMAGLGGLD